MANMQNPSNSLMREEIYDPGGKAGQVLVEGDMVIATTQFLNVGSVAAGKTFSAQFTIPEGYYVISSVVFQTAGNGFVVHTDNYNEKTGVYAVWLKADEALTSARFCVNLVLMRLDALPMQDFKGVQYV